MMIRFGVVGTGIMGEKHAQAYFQSEKATLVATCDLNLDAVAVATPDFAHMEPVVAALEAGKDVIVEKPLATTLKDVDKMVEAVRKSGRKLMVNYGNRLRAQHRMAKSMIQKGELGEPRYKYTTDGEMVTQHRKNVTTL